MFCSAILRSPVSHTSKPGENVEYVCTTQGSGLWYINNRPVLHTYETELEESGFTFHREQLSNYEYYTVNMTMTVVASIEVNQTKIQCKTAGSDGVVVQSSITWLWIAGS